MVMGSGRLLLSSAYNNIASLRVSTLLLSIFVLLLVNNALSTSSSCQFGDCVKSYSRATNRLERLQESGSEGNDMKVQNQQCRVQKKYYRCLKRRQKVCRGDLLFHSIEQMIKRGLDGGSCPPNAKFLSAVNETLISLRPKLNSVATTTIDSFALPERDEITEGSECTYTGKPNYSHCGMFGDPHLRTFYDQFSTCNVEKTWPLIDNDHMVVMVTNVPVKEGFSATATAKVTVLIKAAGKCASQRYFVASSVEGLPGAFTDGSTQTGSVSVVEIAPKRQIEIRAGFIGTTIIIRQVGRHLTFAIRMPREFINDLSSRKQLCVEGCPKRFRVSPEKYIKKSHDLNKQRALPSTVTTASPYFVFEDGSDQLQSRKRLPLLLPNQELHDGTTSSEEQMYFTEKEARIKCKDIILAAIEAQRGVSKDQSKTFIDSKKGAESYGDRIIPLSNTLSSAAFSSLWSSSRSRKSRRKHRTAAARRPKIPSTSFQQLRGSTIEHTEAPLSESKRLSDISLASERLSCEEKRNNKSPLFNFYFESCVFDLVTTGDVNFTLAASAALQDVQRTHSLREYAPGSSLEVIRLWEPLDDSSDAKCPTVKTTTFDAADAQGSGADNKSAFTVTAFLCVALSCLYLNCNSYLFSFSSFHAEANMSKPNLSRVIIFYKGVLPTRRLSATLVTR